MAAFCFVTLSSTRSNGTSMSTLLIRCVRSLRTTEFCLTTKRGGDYFVRKKPKGDTRNRYVQYVIVGVNTPCIANECRAVSRERVFTLFEHASATDRSLVNKNRDYASRAFVWLGQRALITFDDY